MSAAAVSGDERRFQVQVYHEWARVSGGKMFPTLRDMDHVELNGFKDNSFLLTLKDDETDPEFAFVGDNLRADCQDVANLKTLADVPKMSLLSRLTDHYLQCVANRAPVGFEAGFVNRNAEHLLYRGIILPLSADGDHIDHVWGSLSFKTDNDGCDPALPAKKPRKATEAPAVQPSLAQLIASFTEERIAYVGKVREKLNECLKVDGALGVALLDLENRLAIATAGNGCGIDLEQAAAGTANVVQIKLDTVRELGLVDKIEDLVITTSSHLHMMRPLTGKSGSGLVMYLILDKLTANLAMARFKLSTVERDLAE